MSAVQFMKEVLDLPRIHKYKKTLKQSEGTYSEWYRQQVRLTQASDPNAGNGLQERYFGEHPAEKIEECFAKHPEVLILYGDEDAQEDLRGEGKAIPWFRPDWSPELLESCFYPGSLIAVRKTFLEEVLPGWESGLGAFRSGNKKEDRAAAVIFVNEKPDESYFKTMLELFIRAGGWKKGCRSILHLHGIVHHCGSREDLHSFSKGWPEELKTWLRERLAEPGGFTDWTKEREISVIIPSKDSPELLERCIGALKKTGGELLAEVIVVDNGSNEENRERIGKIEGIRYLYRPMEFDFSRMCNLGAGEASGRFLLFLNDDVELRPETDLSGMAALAGRPGVGSVGIKLYYPDSRRIQHAGITNLPMGPVHKLQFLDDEKVYYYGMNRGLRNVLAVSAACVMLEKKKFQEAGGFEATLKVAFNDVALGFRLYELGYRNLCMCDAFAYHHESLSRGADDSEEKLARLLKERDRLFELFPQLTGRDPYYSEFLGCRGLDTGVRPGFETMKNQCQILRPQKNAAWEGFREDPCLMFRVEDERNGEITGYLSVLGDDNACYKRILILENEAGEKYTAELEPKYRPDLKEAMADQKHAALCGFWVRIEQGCLPPGRYRIGAAVDRFPRRIRLISLSSRFMVIK
ncbi:MAG: glycosyltransferase [Lachnospiraceae bacterium]|nr:glycosyltransferase [Lachnospiraceae bacterium]